MGNDISALTNHYRHSAVASELGFVVSLGSPSSKFHCSLQEKKCHLICLYIWIESHIICMVYVYPDLFTLICDCEHQCSIETIQIKQFLNPMYTRIDGHSVREEKFRLYSKGSIVLMNICPVIELTECSVGNFEQSTPHH